MSKGDSTSVGTSSTQNLHKRAKVRTKSIKQHTRPPSTTARESKRKRPSFHSSPIMIASSSLLILGAGVLVRTWYNPASHGVQAWGDPPAQAQRINQLGFNVLQTVLPGDQMNGSTVRSHL